MKFRHTAALVLVGWYLMVHSSLSNWDKPPGWTPPLSQWKTIGSYDSAKECWADWNRQIETVRTSKNNSEYGTALMDAQCIASDDPRLEDRR